MVLLLIFVGGAVGTLVRFTLAGRIYRRFGSAFPWGTLTVNMSGSLALGLVLPFVDLHGPLTPLRAFLTVGTIGAFTTFSTFAYETVMLVHEGKGRRAFMYTLVSVVLGLICIAAGLSLGTLLVR